MGTNRFSSFSRLLLPLLAALLLGSLVQAQEETRPILSCAVEPETVATSGEALFKLRLRNVQAALDLEQLALTIDYTNPNLITTSTADSWQSADLLTLNFAQTTSFPDQIQFRASRVGSATLSAVDGVLAEARIGTLETSALISFTLSAVSLRRADGAEIEIIVDPTCFLAIGDTELPTQTPTATATVDSSVSTPLETPTETLTPAETPTEIPTVPAVIVTPTPRLEDLQSPLATPTPVVDLPGPGQTPDIALTLTAEAQAILLESDLLDPAIETPIPPLPSGLLLTPTATPPPLEVLSPPRLEGTILSAVESAVEDVVAVAAALEGIAQPAIIENAHREPSVVLAVESIQQPPAGIVFERSPLLLRLGWSTFIAAVVLVFTSLWLRRER
jgi:hypothetical protein